jgi:imidazolonepropionase-like amidohydrolase
MKADDQLGSIAAGKLADVVLIDGHPETSISDIRRTEIVMKDGVIYYPSELNRELGISSR